MQTMLAADTNLAFLPGLQNCILMQEAELSHVILLD